ncbi:MAG: hypothetical protein RBS01_02650 [Candidatus Dojkabacteria bacterium]|jgi:hypothetical protein|nr:hypothetical protein [Candidatus Dojkabacteria bacterium]
MDKIETTFLNNPDEYLAIASPDQLLDEYPDQFVEKQVNQNTKILVELSGKNRENSFKERVFCSQNSISLIESDDTYNIWDLDMTDEKVLNSINSKVIGLTIRNEKDKKKSTEDMVIPDYNRLVKVTYLPKTVESSKYLIDMLNKRKELLQK